MFKKIVLAVLAILVMGGSAVAFSWWDKLTVESYENQIITMGHGIEMVVDEVVIDPIEAGNLIPASAVEKTGDTYQVVLTYTVRFDEVTLAEVLDLAVVVSDIEVNSVANPLNLIKVEVDSPATIQNDDVVVTLTVTIDESVITPANSEAAYLALADQKISFTVTFTATRQA